MVSEKHQFLFVHIPKTAGNSIQNVLRDYSEDEIVATGGQDGVERFEVRSGDRGLKKHSTLAEYVAELGAEAVEAKFKFACVRNTWDRMISYFFSPHRQGETWSARKFKHFVEKEVVPLRDYFTRPDVSGGQPFENVDFVIRFESLDQDFAEVCRRIGIAEVSLPVRNRSSRGGAEQYYTPSLIDWVGERFADEIEFFGYQPPVISKAR
ncbi:MAG: sulfotransferase family 2 domain-containing protein [Verrucomicrobiales bacterium]